eukprot:Skav228718  [mRNA]  locus=scaffold1830:153921:154208:- [translate_table: standard]
MYWHIVPPHVHDASTASIMKIGHAEVFSYRRNSQFLQRLDEDVLLLLVSLCVTVCFQQVIFQQFAMLTGFPRKPTPLITFDTGGEVLVSFRIFLN